MNVRGIACVMISAGALSCAELPPDIRALLKAVHGSEWACREKQGAFTTDSAALGELPVPKGVRLKLSKEPSQGFEAEVCDLRNGLYAYIDETGAIYGRSKQVPAISGTFVDPRDGKVYPTLTFGATTWMAANLAFKSKESWCYGDDEKKGEQVGRLYTWTSAKEACPMGWHVATREEWYALVRLAGGRDSCGMRLKSPRLWVDGVPGTEKGFAADVFGFGILPGGKRYDDNEGYGGFGEYAIYWTSTDNAQYGDWGVNLYFGVYGGMVNGVTNKACGFSVRCVKD